MSIARTAATGGATMMAELLEWSSSLDADRHFVREDILGSLAHVTMLGRTGIIPKDAADTIAAKLGAFFKEVPALPLEEDVHMAIERLLTEALGDVAGHLHTARSRNDQVALDLRLYARERGRLLLGETLAFARELITRGRADDGVLLPAYTHRQRAQPVSAAMYFGAWANGLLRASRHLQEAITQADVLPLGSGASSGSSLPIDRQITQKLLGFAKISNNALDTIGDRDFALDLVWASARVMLAMSRLSQDMIDFATSEFGFVKLDGEIAAGSSMMPQKKNPDVFELVRGKSSGTIGRLVQLMTLVKGLPTGYNRDLQEDRQALFGAPHEALEAVKIVRRVLPHVHFDKERCAAALSSGFTQATDLAEALVKRGLPFREAYRAAGALVRHALDKGVALSAVTDATSVHPLFDADTLKALDADRAAAAKESIGGTGKVARARQLETLEHETTALQQWLASVPSLDSLAATLYNR